MAGLTKSEVAVVQKSWAPVSKQWIAKHGQTYLMKLFTAYPGIKATFPYGDLPDAEIIQKPKFRQHVEKFGLYFSDLIASITDDDTFQETIAILVRDHFKRNLTHMPDFNSAFDVLFAVIRESAKLDKATTMAWRKMIQGVVRTMAVEFNKHGISRTDIF